MGINHRVLVPGHWLVYHEQFFPEHFARVKHGAVVQRVPLVALTRVDVEIRSVVERGVVAPRGGLPARCLVFIPFIFLY
jgi:hypothetical protein